MIDLIKSIYQHKIDTDLSIKPELRHAIKKHDRLPVFFQNLAAEINKTNAVRSLKGKKSITREELEFVVNSMTDFFLAGIERQAAERVKSKLQQIKEQQAADYKQSLDDTLEGKETDLSHELGLKIGGTREHSKQGEIEA